MKTRRSIADQRRRSCRTTRRSFGPSPSAETVGGRVGVLQRYVATSYDILEEVHRTLIGDLGKTEVQADRRIAAMKAAFPEALVSHYASLIPAMTNDPKDRHVLAAAVAAGAQVIVTSNLRDFPRHALAPFAIETQSPDEFLTHLLDLDPTLIRIVLTRQADALHNPPKTVSDILIELAPFAPTFTAQMRLTLQLP